MVSVCAGNSSLGNVRQYFRCINEDGVASGRSLVWNSVFIQFLCQVFHLLDTCFEIVEFGVFIQADGKGVHIPSVHSSIGEIAFVLYAETFLHLHTSLNVVWR